MRGAILAKQATVPAGRLPSLPAYVQESRAELRKVTWPTREETQQLTGAVIFMVVTISVFLYVMDNVLSTVVSHLTGIK